ncbi:TetR/AcrR family transcriptional regulator [Nocardia yamanashiensis]|uniref:TetR/AcrR family transcriptional regulator n=1 Tax=Nocardia yamanashiensis TaxID=209247 RepID=UPI000833A0C9|nr:TetR/AcrR family transcriptional regulator [Nocardia yamanashiensis]
MTQSKQARSGPGRPAGTDSTDTRARVIEAAIQCFARYGYGPATNSQIAAEAGVTAGAVFYHFGTKRQLFETVCTDVYGRIIDNTHQHLTEPLSVRGLLRALLESSMRINHQYPELAGFVATAPIDARRYPELSEPFSAVSERMTEGLSDAVRLGQSAGLIPADLDPREVARLVSAVVDGFAHAAAATDPIAMDRLTELFETLLLESGR